MYGTVCVTSAAGHVPSEHVAMRPMGYTVRKDSLTPSYQTGQSDTAAAATSTQTQAPTRSAAVSNCNFRPQGARDTGRQDTDWTRTPHSQH
eukprot:936084-Prymnesium_polylepis.1